MVKEQAEADDDTTMQQRLLMGAGTTLEGASEITDNEIASGQYAQHCTQQSLFNLGLPWDGENVCLVRCPDFRLKVHLTFQCPMRHK